MLGACSHGAHESGLVIQGCVQLPHRLVDLRKRQPPCSAPPRITIRSHPPPPSPKGAVVLCSTGRATTVDPKKALCIIGSLGDGAPPRTRFVIHALSYPNVPYVLYVI